MRRNIQRQAGQGVQRHTVNPTVIDPTLPSFYGGYTSSCCTPLFNSQCLDGSIGIFSTGGQHQLALEWFGAPKAATARRTEIAYLQYMGSVKQPAGATNLPGVPSAICAPGEKTGWGDTCTRTQDCFGLLKLCGEPIIDGGNSLPYCERYPTYTIDGMQITDDLMWQEAVLSEALLNTMAYNLMWGYKDNTTNKLSHYGLWSLLGGYGDARDYVYECPELKPHQLNWNGGEACATGPQAGITLDGQALAAPYTQNLYSTLRDYFRGMMRRLGRTRGFASTSFNYGDWAILGPSEVFECLIACETCFTECQGNLAWMDSERAAARLQELRNAGEGYGSLFFDNFEVPLIPYDPTMILDKGGVVDGYAGSLKNADGTYNLMLLYRGSGSQRVLVPEYNPMSDGTLDTRDNGMVQIIDNWDQNCRTECFRHEWRWGLNRAPFTNLVVKNVACDTLIDDRFATNFDPAPSTVCN